MRTLLLLPLIFVGCSSPRVEEPIYRLGMFGTGDYLGTITAYEYYYLHGTPYPPE